MASLTLALALSLLSFPTLAHDVIDLGTLEVEGEVRQPQVQFYSSKKVSESVVKKAVESQFIDLENELLTAKVKESPEKVEVPPTERPQQ